jgi:XTP/dITP diphosphohydrolase
LKLLLATHNQHKRREFERLLGLTAGGGWGLDALPATVVMPPEDGETFAENALGKARAAAAATGRVSIADDSGIAAAALGGAPGVRSARFAGEHATETQNLDKLLREAPAGSALEYVCVIAYVDPVSGTERVFEGRCRGRLAAEPRGQGGFGYDPAFLPDDRPPGDERPPGDLAGDERPAREDDPAGDERPTGRDRSPSAPTMAELSNEQKDAISHRGRAARALLEWLEGRTHAATTSTNAV